MPIDRRIGFLVCVALLAASVGCGRTNPGYTMLPVAGVVTLEGEPLAGAEVMFDSADAPRGFGLTDEEGRFSVTTRQYGPGLPAGTYRVFVSGSGTTRLGRSGKPVRLASTYQESGLGQVTVTADGEPLSFDLRRQPAGAGRGTAVDDGSGA